jgi:uncharacterized protein YbjT (DUF2867 family)
MILVTGANGTTGREVVGHLAAAGRPVRAIVRKPENAEGLPREGVEVVLGDFSDLGSLESAMTDIDAVFMISFEHPEILELQGNVIAAARQAGVRIVARLSSASADPGSDTPLIRTHGEGDLQLARSGVPYVLLRPQWFNQNFLTYCPGGVVGLPAGAARLAFVDTRDIAAVAIKALSEPGHEGRSYVLTGPEALSHAEVAALLSRATGRRFVYEDVPPEAYRRSLLEGGASEHQADAVSGLLAEVRRRGVAEVHDDIERVLGRPAISFGQFARDYAEALAAQL